MLPSPDLRGIGLLAVYTKSDLYPKSMYVVDISCIPAIACDYSAEMSSAKSISTNLFWPHSIPKLGSSIALVTTKSMMIRTRHGERMQPCITPVSMLNISVFPTFVFKHQLE